MEKTEIAVKPTESILNQVGQRIERIRRRAFELFKGRDQSLDAELDDWLAAERELSLPNIDLRQNEGKFEIEAALPGMEAKDVKVEATREDLFITAEHGVAVAAKADRAAHQSTTQLFGAVHFPSPIDPNTVTANYGKGFLRVSATMAAPPAVRNVEVRA
jgi:HSP20 family molecular chaperone IbpA